MNSENAQELVNNLTIIVELADDNDQTAMNLAAITEVIVNTSAVVAGTTAIPLQQQVNVHNYTGSCTNCSLFTWGKAKLKYDFLI